MSLKISQNKTVKYSNKFEYSKRAKASTITVICGPMFSGKTKRLISEIANRIEDKDDVIVFKPLIDNRYAENEVVSHDKDSVEAINIDNPLEILDLIGEQNVVAIDEVQFFNENILIVAEKLSKAGKDVILAGLDLDYKARPFGPMPLLLTNADAVIKLHSVCTFCNAPAKFTHRITDEGSVVLLGEKDKYVPLCRNCFNDLA